LLEGEQGQAPGLGRPKDGAASIILVDHVTACGARGREDPDLSLIIEPQQGKGLGSVQHETVAVIGGKPRNDRNLQSAIIIGMATPEQGVTQGLHVILSVFGWPVSRQNRP
jgi:hypothetical protein